MANEMLVIATKEMLGMTPEQVVVTAGAIGLLSLAYGFISAWLRERKMRRNLNELSR